MTNQIDNTFEGVDRQICLPVGGPDGVGRYFIYANCDPQCQLTKAELEIEKTGKLEPEKYLGKRLTIVKDRNQLKYDVKP